jgi:2-methylisocitrate lyase-like PEP mutase family enzyme
MTLNDATAKADALRALHVPGDPVVLVNTWDVASARVVAAQAATKTIATASWSVSAALGYDDGEGMPVELALDAAARIVRAVDVPVTVDFEKGYASDLSTLGENVRRLIETGAVGLNIEDSLAAEDGALWSVNDAAARIATVRDAASRAGVPLVINARTDTLIGGGDAADGAIARGRAYLEAGADCIFVLGARGALLREVLTGIPGPVSVLVGAGDPSIRELAAAGVARISFGPGPMGVAYSALRDLVSQLADGTPPPDGLSYRLGRQ